MALDKIVDSSQLDADLTTVADAIRAKGGTSAQLSFPSGMASAIAAISGWCCNRNGYKYNCWCISSPKSNSGVSYDGI